MNNKEQRDPFVNLTIYYTSENGVLSYFVSAHRMTTDGDGLQRRETFDQVRKVRKAYTLRQHDNTARLLCPFEMRDVYAAYCADPDLDGAGWIRRTACDDLGHADHLRDIGVARVNLSDNSAVIAIR